MQTMLEKALAKLREKEGWRKLLALNRAVNPKLIDALIRERDETTISIIYQMAGMGGKMLLANTNVKRMIQAATEGAAKSKRLYFMSGPTGCGKSYAAAAVIEDLKANYTIGYLRITEMNYHSKTALLNEIAKAFPSLNLASSYKTYGYGVYRKLHAQFEQSHGCIVIDEAQKLSMKALELLRDLYDETDLSFVFMASYEFYSRMNVERLDTSVFGQFLRRSDDKYELVHATPDDVREFVSMYGIMLERKEARRISELIGKHGDIDTLSRAFRKIASLHEEGELEWNKVGAGDIEDAIRRVITIQKVDNLAKEAA
ncbi:MAG: AAA family ATPase [Bacteroidetes bacterium]|nr:MAG: AAA family ATPase [Bacteroidota bacterium]